MTTKEILEALRSTTCVCGQKKSEGRSFCRGCYYELPQRVRSGLYKKVRQGYEEFYVEALGLLGQAVELEQEQTKQQTVAELLAAIRRGGLDLQPCCCCGLPVACLPAEPPLCDDCHDRERRVGGLGSG